MLDTRCQVVLESVKKYNKPLTPKSAMKIKVTVQTDLVGSKVDRTIELDEENLTDEDLEEIARDTMFEMIEWNWKRL